MTQSGFYQADYEIVAQIPAGKVVSYGQIARLTGRPRYARGVGYAMRAAPEGLPCHRVVFQDGSLCYGECFGGTCIHRAMLEGENVPFLPDGRVDMEKARWQGPLQGAGREPVIEPLPNP